MELKLKDDHKLVKQVENILDIVYDRAHQGEGVCMTDLALKILGLVEYREEEMKSFEEELNALYDILWKMQDECEMTTEESEGLKKIINLIDEVLER